MKSKTWLLIGAAAALGILFAVLRFGAQRSSMGAKPALGEASRPSARVATPRPDSRVVDANVAHEEPAINTATAISVSAATPNAEAAGVQRQVVGTMQMVAAHAPLRAPEVADPDSETNRRILQTMVVKAITLPATPAPQSAKN